MYYMYMIGDIFIVVCARLYEQETGADQGFGQGGAPASEAESCRHSEAESREWSKHSAAGVQGPLKGPGSFWVFDAQICILTHSRVFFSYFWHLFWHQKLIKIEH